MAEVHNFRSAFHGFNREDVVRYISYINNRHNDQINQLNSEKQALLDELNATKNLVPAEDLKETVARLEAECAELKARCAELEQSQAAAAAATQEAAERTIAEAELEAYRRAERMERLANERAEQLCQQVNGVLADTTAKVENASNLVSDLSDRVMGQLMELQTAVTGSKQILRDATATLYTIRPTAENE